MLDSPNLSSFDNCALPLACKNSLCISKGSEKLILIEWFPSFLENIDQPYETKLFYICRSRVTGKVFSMVYILTRDTDLPTDFINLCKHSSMSFAVGHALLVLL